ncbi:REP-associated tyrosine transposase [Flagellimonas sp. 2504JD4-2]
MSRNYKFHNQAGVYFVSFATVYWIDVFTRQKYFDVLANSIAHCRKEKGMELFAYCFMPSHIHLMFRSKNNDPSGLLRDFKRHTSKEVLKMIRENPQESRKEWLLEMFERAAQKKKNVEKQQFWQHHNKPIELWSPAVIKQKLDYIHNNPVNSGLVVNPEDWKYSSARNFNGDSTILEVDEIGFLG